MLYKVLIHCNSHQKQLTRVTRQCTSVIKMSVACMNVRVSRHLKQELAWAIDKWLRVISNPMLFKTVIYTTKNLKNKPFYIENTILCIAIYP